MAKNTNDQLFVWNWSMCITYQVNHKLIGILITRDKKVFFPVRWTVWPYFDIDQLKISYQRKNVCFLKNNYD